MEKKFFRNPVFTAQCYIFVWALLLLPGLVYAQTEVGKISEVQPPATITRIDGKPFPAQKDLVLYAGDRIETQEGGQLSFSIFKLGFFKMDEMSEIAIDELSSAVVDEEPPVLELVIGFVRSQIHRLSGSSKTIMHTPTAVVGVRGTEFDTLVGVDAVTMIAVDEGSIDIASEDKQAVVSKGMMAESDIDRDTIRIEQAVPKDRREWRRLRQERRQRFIRRFDRVGPSMEKRFYRSARRFTTFSKRLAQASELIVKEMETARNARKTGKKRVFRQSIRRLKIKAAAYKVAAGRYRYGLNRITTAGKIVARMERFLTDHMEELHQAGAAEKAETVLGKMKKIQEKRQELIQLSRKTITGIKDTFKALEQFRSNLTAGNN